MKLKKNLFFFGLHGLVFDLETIGSFLDYDLTADIGEKTISILAGNLNSGCSYLYYSCNTGKMSRPDDADQMVLISERFTL